jgi:hypothetical protein
VGDWANALQDRVDYLVVKNKVAGEDFSYLFESEPGQRTRARRPDFGDLHAGNLLLGSNN